MSTPISSHARLCLSDSLSAPSLKWSSSSSSSSSSGVYHTYKWMLTDRSRGHTSRPSHLHLWAHYIWTHWNDHLAPATVRLMQNTTRLGRWQLHQEARPQHAKELPGYEELIRWALTCGWAVAEERRRSRWRLEGWGGAEALQLGWSFLFFVLHRIVFFPKLPQRIVTECKDPSGAPAWSIFTGTDCLFP